MCFLCACARCQSAYTILLKVFCFRFLSLKIIILFMVLLLFWIAPKKVWYTYHNRRANRFSRKCQETVQTEMSSHLCTHTHTLTLKYKQCCLPTPRVTHSIHFFYYKNTTKQNHSLSHGVARVKCMKNKHAGAGWVQFWTPMENKKKNGKRSKIIYIWIKF